jgi:retron-type reverse transcriptase
MYDYKKGRNTLQAISFLKTILQKSNTKHSRTIPINIKECFDSIPHEATLTHFNIANK